MKFEEMTYRQIMSKLKSCHRRINKRVFDNMLEEVDLDIENINGHFEEGRPNCFAIFISRDKREDKRSGLSKISFDYEMFDYMECMDEEEQMNHFVMILLHEMIHQFCYENNIDDSNHNENFMNEAVKRGLWSCYENGELIFEELWYCFYYNYL